MSNRWYNDDWLTVALVCVAIAAMVIGNYYYNGGHLVW